MHLSVTAGFSFRDSGSQSLSRGALAVLELQPLHRLFLRTRSAPFLGAARGAGCVVWVGHVGGLHS